MIIVSLSVTRISFSLSAGFTDGVYEGGLNRGILKDTAAFGIMSYGIILYGEIKHGIIINDQF